MPALKMDLQEGFKNDTVIVYVDGMEIIRREGVTTRLSASVAESMEIQTPKETARIGLNVPTRNQSADIEINVLQYPYMGVSLRLDGTLSLQPSRDFFRYL